MVVRLEVELVDGPEVRDVLDVGATPLERLVETAVRRRTSHGQEHQIREGLLGRSLGVKGSVPIDRRWKQGYLSESSPNTYGPLPYSWSRKKC